MACRMNSKIMKAHEVYLFLVKFGHAEFDIVEYEKLRGIPWNKLISSKDTEIKNLYYKHFCDIGDMDPYSGYILKPSEKKVKAILSNYKKDYIDSLKRDIAKIKDQIKEIEQIKI